MDIMALLTKFVNENFTPGPGHLETAEEVIDIVQGTTDNADWDEQSKKGFTVYLLDDGEMNHTFITYKGTPLYLTIKVSGGYGPDGGFDTWGTVKNKKLGTQLGLKSIGVRISGTSIFTAVTITTKTDKLTFKFAEDQEEDEGEDW